MKTYTIKSTGSGKLAANLAALCAPGKLGEPLVRNGATQDAVALFGAKVAYKMATDGKTPEDIASVFSLLSIANASALKQALATCSLKFDGEEKEVSVSAYWEKSGSKAASPDLSLLGDL